jgi:hypothetical protein
MKYRYSNSKNNSIDLGFNNLIEEKIVQKNIFDKTKKGINNNSINTKVYNSINKNYIFGNKEEIISRTNTILNMNQQNYKSCIKNNNSYSLNTSKICKNDIIEYNKNKRKNDIPLNPNHSKHNAKHNTKHYLISQINIDNISNKKYCKYNYINDLNNINSNTNINNNSHIIKKNNKYYKKNVIFPKYFNKSNRNNSSFDINNCETKPSFGEISNTINNYINIDNSKNNNKRIIIEGIKHSKESEISTKKYLTKKTINKYFSNSNILKNFKGNKNKKNILTKKNFSYIRTIESSGKKGIKSYGNNKTIKYNINNKDNLNKANIINNNNCNKNNDKYKKKEINNKNVKAKNCIKTNLFPAIFPKRINKIKYSILSKEANNMIKDFSAEKKALKSRNKNNNQSYLVNKTTSNRYISSPVISQGNKSYD